MNRNAIIGILVVVVVVAGGWLIYSQQELSRLEDEKAAATLLSHALGAAMPVLWPSRKRRRPAGVNVSSESASFEIISRSIFQTTTHKRGRQRPGRPTPHGCTSGESETPD